jgi:hypothetical protein
MHLITCGCQTCNDCVYEVNGALGQRWLNSLVIVQPVSKVL